MSERKTNLADSYHNKLHDCKRGLDIATSDDYNKWWRYIIELEAELTHYKRIYGTERVGLESKDE